MIFFDVIKKLIIAIIASKLLYTLLSQFGCAIAEQFCHKKNICGLTKNPYNADELFDTNHCLHHLLQPERKIGHTL